MAYKVLAMDDVAPEGLEPLYQESDIEVVIGTKMTEDELAAVIGEYDAMIVRSATKVTPKVLENATKLKIVGRAGVGVDNIDLDASTQHGVLVVNAPDGNTIAATEQTVALMLALARSIPQAAAKLKNGEWDKKSFVGVELRGKKLGVIGLGRIGAAVARRAQALEMDIIGYDPYIPAEKAADMGIKLVSLDDLFKAADFITVHMPKTKETSNMLNDQAFAAMKDGVRIINCARGGIIDEAALYKYMQSDKVAGAALDVFDKEPTTDSPLFALNNFIATPHLGASTEEAQLNVAIDVAKEIVNALHDDVVHNTVNVPSVSAEVLAKIQPYLKLAERLGKLQAQLVEGRVNKLEIIYNGDLAQEDVKSVTTSVLKGFLDPILQESVNFVNAPLLAKNRGITVEQTVGGEAKGYASLITLKVISDKGEKAVSGTLFQDKESRIVIVDGYRIDVIPEGNILYVPHMDKPRIIGPVGTIIGEHNINIASMQVGRKEIGGKAVMMLTVDCPVDEETVKDIKAVDGVLDVKFISL